MCYQTAKHGTNKQLRLAIKNSSVPCYTPSVFLLQVECKNAGQFNFPLIALRISAKTIIRAMKSFTDVLGTISVLYLDSLGLSYHFRL